MCGIHSFIRSTDFISLQMRIFFFLECGKCVASYLWNNPAPPHLGLCNMTGTPELWWDREIEEKAGKVVWRKEHELRSQNRFISYPPLHLSCSIRMNKLSCVWFLICELYDFSSVLSTMSLSMLGGHSEVTPMKFWAWIRWSLNVSATLPTLLSFICSCGSH